VNLCQDLDLRIISAEAVGGCEVGGHKPLLQPHSLEREIDIGLRVRVQLRLTVSQAFLLRPLGQKLESVCSWVLMSAMRPRPCENSRPRLAWADALA
jgi:hypothetical protein